MVGSSWSRFGKHGTKAIDSHFEAGSHWLHTIMIDLVLNIIPTVCSTSSQAISSRQGIDPSPPFREQTCPVGSSNIMPSSSLPDGPPSRLLSGEAPLHLYFSAFLLASSAMRSSSLASDKSFEAFFEPGPSFFVSSGATTLLLGISGVVIDTASFLLLASLAIIAILFPTFFESFFQI